MTFTLSVLNYIKENKMIADGDRLLLAVSGGVDSMTMLHFFHQVQAELSIEIAVITVEHGLRGEKSKDDAAFVKTWCEKNGILCYVSSVDVKAYQKAHKVSTQIAARVLRYDTFYQVMKSEHYDSLALAHHLDDQVETSLMAFVKTTQPHLLTGIPDKRGFYDKKIIRPLLERSRHEIETYAKEQQLEIREDASNASLDYMRNRMRHEVIPKLKRENSDLLHTNLVLRQSLAEDDALLNEIAERQLEKAFLKQKDGQAVKLSLEKLKAAKPAILRRIFRLVTGQFLHIKVIDYKHEEKFLKIIYAPGNKQIDLPQKFVIYKTYDYVLIKQEAQPKALNYKIDLKELPFSVYLDGYGTMKGEKVIDDSTELSPYEYSLPIEAGWPLWLRTRQSGDRMAYDGLKGSKKINRIFIDEKVPAHLRMTWPILTNRQGDIIWIPGLRKKTIQSTAATAYIKLTFLKDEGE